MSVGILFDVSGSMSGDKVRRARDALAHFVQTSHDRDDIFHWFQLASTLLMDQRVTAGRARQVDLRPNQKQHRPVRCLLPRVERVQRRAHPKRALLLISDGQDNNSRYTFNELREF